MLADYPVQPASLSCAADRSASGASVRHSIRFCSETTVPWPGLLRRVDVIHARLHDRQAAARLGQLRNRALPGQPAGPAVIRLRSDEGGDPGAVDIGAR